VFGETTLEGLKEKNVAYHFASLLPAPIRTCLDAELPSHILVPSGSKIPVLYPEQGPPSIEVRVQEVFGLMESPRILLGTVPILMNLLAPNYRSVQLTGDLASFWKNAYGEVRKELRARYPKHQWPEDPRNGIPEAKGRRRSL
jgi:ATP-dependent helicase HrpB